jgi:hypothetical protein
VSDTTREESIENYSDLISSTALAHVMTTGPKGEPHSNPVGFDWHGEHLKVKGFRVEEDLGLDKYPTTSPATSGW